MILKTSMHTRIFQRNGSLSEISFILNLFNKYNGIYNIMKMIKTQKLIYFDLIKIVKKLISNLLNSFTYKSLNEIDKKRKHFFNKIFKCVSTIFICFLFKQNLPKNLNIHIFLELKKKKYMKKNLSFSSFSGKTNKILFLTNHSKKNKKFLFNNKYYNSNSDSIKPIKNFLKTFRNKNNNNIFVTGDVFDFYEGSITPYSKSNLSFLISTGLKADVECNDLDLFKNLYTKESIPNFYEDDIKNAIFKVLNFKKKIVNNIKQNVRQLFFYNTYQFFGFQRFLSEKMISFTLLQHEKKFDFENFFFYLNKKLQNQIFQTQKFFFVNKQKIKPLEIEKNSFSLFSEKSKSIFLYFKMSKSLLSFYLFLSHKQDSLDDDSINFYKSLILFKFVSKKFITIFKNIFKRKISKIGNFFLEQNTSGSRGILKKNSKILQIFFLNFNLTNEIIKNTLKFSFFEFFFNLFLKRKYRSFFINKLKFKKKRSPERTAQIYSILAKKPYCFFVYKLFSFYFNFLIDWKLNFNILIKNNAKLKYHFHKLSLTFLEPLSFLLKKWDYNSFINFKELHLFFYEALEKLVLNLNSFFYQKFLMKKNINLNLKFLVSNLFIYVSKLTAKETNENFFLLNDFVKLSDFFLGKWFYYKQKNKFFNNLFDAHYNIFNPSKISDLSQKEIYINNLLRINFSGDFIFKNLDTYLKKAAKKFDSTNINKARIKKLKKKLKKLTSPIIKRMVYHKTAKKNVVIGIYKKTGKEMKETQGNLIIVNKNAYKYNFMKKMKLTVIEDMFTNLYNYRNYRWSKKFSESVNNSLEVGFKFRLPRISEGKKCLNKNRYRKDLEFNYFSKIRRNFFRKYFRRFYENNSYKPKELILTNTFLCIYKNFKFEKKNLYQKTLFWFHK